MTIKSIPSIKYDLLISFQVLYSQEFGGIIVECICKEIMNRMPKTLHGVNKSCINLSPI